MSTGNNHQENNDYLSIGEAAKRTGVKTSVLRFWENEFSELSPVKNKFGHRAYQSKDVVLILKIKYLLYERGLTINGAKKVLQENETDHFSSVDTKALRKELEGMLELLNKRKSHESKRKK